MTPSEKPAVYIRPRGRIAARVRKSPRHGRPVASSHAPRFTEARKAIRFSRPELARFVRSCGVFVTEEEVRGWEREGIRPNPRVVAVLAPLFDRSVEDFLSLFPSKPPGRNRPCSNPSTSS